MTTIGLRSVQMSRVRCAGFEAHRSMSRIRSSDPGVDEERSARQRDGAARGRLGRPHPAGPARRPAVPAAGDPAAAGRQDRGPAGRRRAARWPASRRRDPVRRAVGRRRGPAVQRHRGLRHRRARPRAGGRPHPVPDRPRRDARPGDPGVHRAAAGTGRRALADPRLEGVPINAIAARWGFPNDSHFSRTFRAAFGVTPAAYRWQAREDGSADSR
ncbi:helix-turn-helix domain-containing protein [Nonomuraea harbinensis]|uniref:Helix-turn-helix domain-containing protein n=1 Tax=Nonomuraea harbinensis TaxID=1286938 RepID=A0ABW1BZS2_9ACTN